MAIDPARLRALLARLANLSESQGTAIENIIGQFERSFTFVANPRSDLVTECVLREFGDTLRIHHCFSGEAFTKDKFEYALERAVNFCGGQAARARRGNRGHDITINGVPFSLKTQANAGIRADSIHISKFMELGKGQWSDKPAELAGLRDSFLEHMRSYERILTLRYIPTGDSHHYELVEIPKRLLAEAATGAFEMMSASKQMPKPGTCTVTDRNGDVKFQLYFDGGTERKLQIRKINKALCVVHGEWSFAKDATITEENALYPGLI
ncbi:MAG TPA: hypothetical protein VN709_08335 [Terriglobales bacterium]|nr:hypothetical protein [Terriglobales bacterium]